MARRFLAWIQFDGSAFCGYARQGEQRSVCYTLEQAWWDWREERVKFRSSSRTDSGVHARRMPVLIQTEQRVPAKAVVFGLNMHLPADLAVIEAAPVDEAFHVRHDAIGKRYVYRIYNGRARQPLLRHHYWHVTRPLDEQAMATAATAFIGTHDFSAFRAAHCQAKTSRRAIRLVEVQRQGDVMLVTVEGNAFLHNMVRIMVGTLVEIGWGKIAAEDLPGIIASKDRLKAGQTAPAVGLTLDDVFYGVHGAKEGLNFKKLDGQVVESTDV